MVFLADEYQGLITVDKTGVCLTDFNTPNISRSTGLILFIITQSYIAFEQVIGKEATHNFIAQMRNRVYLASEDASTRDDVVKLVGKAYIFEHALKENLFLLMENLPEFLFTQTLMRLSVQRK